MTSTQDILIAGNLAAWADHLGQLKDLHPDTWADKAFGELARYPNCPLPFCPAVLELADRGGWGSSKEPWNSLVDAASHGQWDLVPMILQAPVDVGRDSDEIDYLAVRDLDRGLWTHIDLLRPNAFLSERNLGKLGHDLFKHNEDTYFSPLKENVIAQLVKLPKHEKAGQILATDFVLTQRVPDCFTDLDAPGALPSLVLLVNAGWLDLEVARQVAEPREAATLERIARVEHGVLRQREMAVGRSSALRRI